jgi:uncharacterized protein YkwD
MLHPKIVATAFALAALTGCASDELVRTVSPAAVTTSTKESVEAARLITRYRAEHKLGPVSPDNQLNAAAESQARAVAEAGRLSHGAFTSRMDEYAIGGHAAENLSAGADSPEAALARWKRSSGHNANLLLKQAKRIGFARADSPGHGYKRYWALVLAQ